MKRNQQKAMFAKMNSRKYTIRKAEQDGSIETVGKFNKFPTAAQAKKALLADVK